MQQYPLIEATLEERLLKIRAESHARMDAAIEGIIDYHRTCSELESRVLLVFARRSIGQKTRYALERARRISNGIGK